MRIYVTMYMYEKIQGVYINKIIKTNSNINSLIIPNGLGWQKYNIMKNILYIIIFANFIFSEFPLFTCLNLTRINYHFHCSLKTYFLFLSL